MSHINQRLCDVHKYDSSDELRNCKSTALQTFNSQEKKQVIPQPTSTSTKFSPSRVSENELDLARIVRKKYYIVFFLICILHIHV